jgi:hypothetical protein
MIKRNERSQRSDLQRRNRIYLKNKSCYPFGEKVPEYIGTFFVQAKNRELG